MPLPFFPNAASTMASQVDLLFFFLLALATFFALLVAGSIIFFSIKYRRRAEDQVPEQILGSNRLEAVWTIIPLGLAMVAFFWGADLYLNMARPPDKATEIFIVAKQWMWRVQHENGTQEINELHVPVGRPIKLTMTSQDVIHGFFVPDFRIKQDVLPGRYTTTWFQATRVGTYRILCSQYCGTGHSVMEGLVTVMSPSNYDAWLAAGAGQSPAAAGARLFQQLGCILCHGDARRAPPLQGIYGQPVKLQSGGTAIADENYLRESILNPNAKTVAGYQPIMPTFQGRLNEEQLLQLIAYIKSLGANATPPAGVTPTP